MEDETSHWDFIASKENKNTVKKTELCVKRYREWLVESPRHECRDLKDIPPARMNMYIGNFLMTLRKTNGDEYEPDTIT